MTTGHTLTTAGLIFNGSRDFDIVNIGNRIRNAFEALEETVTGVRILSNDSACISSRHHDLQVTLHEDHAVEGLETPAPMLLKLAIADAGPGAAWTDETPRQDTVLAHALKALHWTLSADQVKWVTPGAILSSADFVMATSDMEPEAAARLQHVSIGRNKAGVVERRYAKLPSIEETNELIHKRMTQKEILLNMGEEHGKLSLAFRTDPDLHVEPAQDDIREETAPLRLSVWMVSFAVALFALPVGAALLVFNLCKGENLRLTSQMAALTGTFISFQAYGTTAQAMTALQNIIG